MRTRRADGGAVGAKGHLVFRPRLWTSVVAVPALGILLSLGFWQLHRLAWKEALIQNLEDRTTGPAVPLPAGADLIDSDLAELEFRRVRVTGELDLDSSLSLLNRTFEGKVGVHVIAPLVRPDGDVVLMDLGWSPPDFAPGRAKSARDASDFEGFVRLFHKPGMFVPENEVGRGLWYAMNATEMAAAVGVAAVAPVYVTVAPSDDAEGYPQAIAPAVNLRNDHLQYAITWFGLAAGLIAVFVAYHTRRADD